MFPLHTFQNISRDFILCLTCFETAKLCVTIRVHVLSLSRIDGYIYT
jgi:hypothetical protein